MYYDYAELRDGTQIAFSNVLADNTIKISVERPVDNGFDTARCILPAYQWSDIEGFSSEEMGRLDDFIHKNAPLITRLAYEESRFYA